MNTVWHELWTSPYGLVVTLWKWQFCLMEDLEMCAGLLASNILKILVLFDINSGKVCSIACQ